ncbi:hypothetical protein [Rouxiella badensis]|uniref:transcriptional antitermination N peptide n=1 Tax=Rouxiella badensis TaxID=1646377 RepID=UPI0022AB0A7F|nr:hypothetical protein [Rouxiella badensis]WAT10108.1 hypothetical protein O1V65_05975 [Rouxiella badensis]
MNAKERKKLARAAVHRAERMKDVELEKRVAVSLSGCSTRVYKAITLIEYKAKPRSKPEPDYGSICIPDVARFAAGHRKSAETVTAR